MEDQIFFIIKPIKQVVSDYSNYFFMKTTYREQNETKLKRNYTIAIKNSETSWY